MVCALHSNWQLCGKRRSVIFVLGNINSHPSVKENKKELQADLGTRRLDNTVYSQDNEERKAQDDRVTSAPDLSVCFVPVLCQTTELLPPPPPLFPPFSARKPISCQ